MRFVTGSIQLRPLGPWAAAFKLTRNALLVDCRARPWEGWERYVALWESTPAEPFRGRFRPLTPLCDS
jgi:hypothetical protein